MKRRILLTTGNCSYISQFKKNAHWNVVIVGYSWTKLVHIGTNHSKVQKQQKPRVITQICNFLKTVFSF